MRTSASGLEPELGPPEPEPVYFPGSRAGAGADKKCHGSASLIAPPTLL